MNHRGFLKKLIVFLAMTLVAATSVNGQTRSFQQLVDAYFDDYFKVNPSQATSVGFHQHDHQLEDFSLAAHQHNRSMLLQYLADFESFDPRPLTRLERDDREIMIATIQSLLLEEDRVQMWRKNPDAYSGAVTSSIFSLVKRNFAPTDERLRSVIEREKQIPRALARLARS